MDNDPYFKDFKLLDYRFVVVNRKSIVPLVWEWPLTQATGVIDIETPSGFKYHLRDPETIGKELDYYLKENKKLPREIEETKPNNILTFIKYIG